MMVALAILAILAVLHQLACWRYRLPPLRIVDDTPNLPPPVPIETQHPGLTGIHTLDEAQLAFAARVLLVRGARVSLDLQSYIWHHDTSGLLLLEEVRQAADRGVRVRLLLDDNGIAGLDAVLTALAGHALISVRLFNPFVIRRPKAIGYLLDFRRLNRRMHNKSFTADCQFTIVGGRNIGDEYFGAGEKSLFADLDVFVAGAAVADVAADFERYWLSESAWPATQILPAATDDGLDVFSAQIATLLHTPLAKDYASAVRNDVVQRLVAGELALEWAPATLFSDDPAKGLGMVAESQLLGPLLAAAIGEPRHDLALVSAYFVPTGAGVKAFAAMAADGTRVQVMTNALQTTDVAMVHAGYSHSRKPLLRAGVRLWEMKGGKPDKRVKLRLRRRRHEQKVGTIFRSNGSALHAKTFTVDRQRLFVGSFNFDPRSLRLNTELGLIIDSPVLAGRLQDMFRDDVAGYAYEVRLAGNRLQWIERTDGGDIVHCHEPGTGPLQRAIMALLSHLPVKWLL